MQTYLIHASSLFGFGFLGILIMAFIKMADINKMSESYTFGYVLGKFTKREWPSYGLALVVILTACLSYEEWLPLFTSKIKDKYNVTIGVKLFMVLFGCLGQYLIYKRLGKMAKQPPPDEITKP